MTYADTKRVLLAQGLMDEDGATHRPRPGHCRHCRHAVLAAITDAGLTVLLWPTPTTPLGELHALLAGLRTFTALPADLLYRDAWRIQGRDADHVHVHVEHRCGHTPPPPNPIHATTVRTVVHDAPPF